MMMTMTMTMTNDDDDDDDDGGDDDDGDDADWSCYSWLLSKLDVCRLKQEGHGQYADM